MRTCKNTVCKKLNKRTTGKLTTVKVEEETTHVSIINFTTSVRLILSYNLHCTAPLGSTLHGIYLNNMICSAYKQASLSVLLAILPAVHCPPVMNAHLLLSTATTATGMGLFLTGCSF